ELIWRQISNRGLQVFAGYVARVAPEIHLDGTLYSEARVNAPLPATLKTPTFADPIKYSRVPARFIPISISRTLEPVLNGDPGIIGRRPGTSALCTRTPPPLTNRKRPSALSRSDSDPGKTNGDSGGAD